MTYKSPHLVPRAAPSLPRGNDGQTLIEPVFPYLRSQTFFKCNNLQVEEYVELKRSV